MDGDGQQRRQYEQSLYPEGYSPGFGGQYPTVPNLENVRGVPQGEGSDCLRQPHILTTQTLMSAPLPVAACSPQVLANYGYLPGHPCTTPGIYGLASPYGPEYAQESQRQRCSQYQSPMMQSQYEPSAQYEPQQAVAEALWSPFRVPQEFYTQGDIDNVSGFAVTPDTYPTAAQQQSIQYNQPILPWRSTLASSYPTMTHHRRGNVKPEELAGPDQELDTHAELFATYNTALRETNENTFRGRLIEAGASLANLSEWLLTHAAGLGTSVTVEL